MVKLSYQIYLTGFFLFDFEWKSSKTIFIYKKNRSNVDLLRNSNYASKEKNVKYISSPYLSYNKKLLEMLLFSLTN
jgi:hypothetical protein